jgi:hypothetical protein
MYVRNRSMRRKVGKVQGRQVFQADQVRSGRYRKTEQNVTAGRLIRVINLRDLNVLLRSRRTRFQITTTAIHTQLCIQSYIT